MKIICTKKEQWNLQKTFNKWVDIPKVWGYCPFAFIYCPHTPLGDIEPEQCRECLKNHLEWEITEDNTNG